MAGVQDSSSKLLRGFGYLPNNLAQGLGRQQLGPLNALLGFGATEGQGSNRYNKLLSQMDTATGPLAEFIRDVRGFAPDFINQGQNIAAQGQQSYDTLTSQINGALGALPNYQAAANQGLGYAQQSAADAYSPIRDSALFQRTSADVLRPLQASAAGRGLLESGGAQQQEQDVLQNLGLQFALNSQNAQQQALQGLQGATGFAQGMSTAGIPLAQQQFNALGSLQGAQNAPLQNAQALYALLSGGVAPQNQLIQGTSPISGQDSKGFSIL